MRSSHYLLRKWKHRLVARVFILVLALNYPASAAALAAPTPSDSITAVNQLQVSRGGNHR